WVGAMRSPFHGEGGPELRAAVAAVTARLTAALGAGPDNRRFAAPDNTRFAAPDNTRFAAPDNTRLSLPAERYLGGLLDVALEGGGAGPGRRRQAHLGVVVDHDGLPGTVRAGVGEGLEAARVSAVVPPRGAAGQVDTVDTQPVVLGEQLARVVDGDGRQQLALLRRGQQPSGQQGAVEPGD